MLQQFGRNFDDLFGGFAGAVNHFRKAFAQSAMQIHLSKTEVRHRRRLERADHVIAADTARTKLFQQFNGILRSHAWKMVERFSKNKSQAPGQATRQASNGDDDAERGDVGLEISTRR